MWWRVGFKVSRAWYRSASVGVVPDGVCIAPFGFATVGGSL